MKIVLFLPNVGGGGSERVFINLAVAMKPLVSSVVLVLASCNGEYIDNLSGIEIVDLAAGRVAESIVPLAKFLRKAKADILISAGIHTNIAAILAVKLALCPTRLVITSHASVRKLNQFAGMKEKLVILASHFFYRFASGLIAVSKGVLDDELAFRSKNFKIRTAVIYNPILSDNKFQLGPRIFVEPRRLNEQYLIVSAGRLCHQKNFHSLLTAFSKLRVRSKFRLVIYGDGPFRNQLEYYSHSLGISNQVSFPGFVHNLADRLLEADIFVLSSIYEGFGNVLVEALFAGCAVISTDCPNGPSEILANGKYGLLLPVNDTDALADSIDYVAAGNGTIYNIDEAVMPYLSGQVAEQYIKFFKAILKS